MENDTMTLVELAVAEVLVVWFLAALDYAWRNVK
jgi:hypothetical protein